ncbi:sialin-like isoform X2 [Ceratitis capitata]|uniref:sialin-like isoform X2 n=1 Tax=Ceratitis capitata TaxID=7213 RepID=UPI000329781C|nr:sialin-like isoform X2 [Ceratitis capitata]
MATAMENFWLAQQSPQIGALIKKHLPWLQAKQKQLYDLLNNVPQRFILCFFGFLAIVNAYTMRHCLDIALTHIVAPQERRTLVPNFDQIKMSEFNIYKRMEQHRNGSLTSFARRKHERLGYYDWSDQLQTFILISFYVGYVLSHVPSAQLAIRYGGKWVLAIGMAITALLTICTPFVVKWGGPVALMALRLLIGLSEGPTYPALSELLSRWVPGKERATLGSLVLSGSQIGISMGNFIAGLLLHRYDWTWIFYYFGICALLWFIGFIFLCYNTPAENPYIKVMEKEYLEKEIGLAKRCQQKKATTPWKHIFSNIPMWALISATVQYDWTQLQYAAEVPQFIRDAKKQPLLENLLNGLQNQMPYIVNWLLSVLSGVLSDLLVNYEIISVTVVRKLMTIVAAVAPNLYNSLLPCLGTNEGSDIFAFCHCAINVLGSYYAGIKLTPLDMSPNFAATLMGIANGIGSLTGIVAPFIQRSFGGWPRFRVLRAILWLISTLLISGEIQPFDQLIPLAGESNKSA